MGFSSSVTATIFFMCFLLVGAILAGAFMDMERARRRALDEREDMDMAREEAEVQISSILLDGSDLELSLVNSGESTIDLSCMDAMVGGWFKNITSVTVGGSPAGNLYQDEVLDITIPNIHINATTNGGSRVCQSTCSLTAPTRLSASRYTYVLDGTDVRCLDNDCTLLWSLDSGLTAPVDIASNSDRVLVMGDGKVVYAPSNGSSDFSDLISTGLNDGTDLIIQSVSGSDPYIIILQSSGNISRYEWDGTGANVISINGTNVNWTGPVDITPGNGVFHLIDGDGSIYNLSFSGEDTSYESVSMALGESVIALSSTGMYDHQILVMVRSATSSRVLVQGPTDFELVGSLPLSISDLDCGIGLHMVDTSGLTISRYTLGTAVRLAFLSGYVFSEVV